MVAGYWLLVTGQGHFNPQQATRKKASRSDKSETALS